jgi:AraC-like DNA-binding protein
MTAVIRTGALRGYQNLVRELGGQPLRLLRRHDIQPASLEDEDALIPLRSLLHLMEATAQTLDCPDFGLRLGQRQDIGILGMLALAIQHSRTVDEALQCASRHLFVHSPAVVFSVLRVSAIDRTLAELRLEFQLPRLPQTRQFMDHCLAVTYRIVSLLLRDRNQLRAVCVDHTPLAPLSAYQRCFGAPTRIAQRHGALLIPPACLDEPLHSVNESLRRMAAEYLDVHFPAPGQSISARVRLALSRTLGSAPARREDVAQMLALHPRTLLRRLAAEGCSFEQLREEVRREAALRYLCDPGIPLAQVAELLGLSEQSALTRSCRRWFGRTPSQLRATPMPTQH